MVSSALDHNKPRVLVSGLSNGLGGTEIVVGRYIKALSSYATFEFLATSDLSDVAFVHEMNSEIHICPDIDRPIKRFEYLDHLFQDEPIVTRRFGVTLIIFYMRMSCEQLNGRMSLSALLILTILVFWAVCRLKL